MITENLGLDPIVYSKADLEAIKDTSRYRHDLYAMPPHQRRKYLTEEQKKAGNAFFGLLLVAAVVALSNA